MREKKGGIKKMPRDNKLPPPTGRGRKGPEMMDEDPAIVGKLSQLAGMGGEGAPMGGMGGMMRGAGGSEEQSASLLMSGAQQLMQAAQMNPALQDMVNQVIIILRQGVQGLAGAEVGGEEIAPTRGGGGGKRRMRPPRVEREAEENQFTY